MSITIKKYIDITSAVAGAPATTTRELIQRLFTTNILVPVNGFIEITTLAEVGTFFETTSNEFLRAVEYFGFVGKNATSNNKMSFAGYSTVAVEALIIGNQQAQALATLQTFTSATITIDIGGFGGTTAAINLSGAASIAAAMTLIEDAIQLLDADSRIAAATVIFDPVGQRVVLTAGATGENVITFSSVTSGFLDTLGWGAGSATSDGTDGDTITAVLTASDALSDNFGSIVFNETLSLSDATEAATFTDGENVKYIYCKPVIAAESQGDFTALQNFSGTALTLITGAATDFAESIPAILLGSTNYEGVNSVLNYMFQQVNYPVSVTDTATSDTFDAIRTNYNGQTQQAGQNLFFYQRGLLLGLATDPLDMNTFANEMWFKDDILVSLMNLLLAVNRVSANDTGVLQVTGAINGSIDKALINGTISIGKTLTSTQIATIQALTQDPAAADQVSNAGYYLTVEIVIVGSENNAEYTLIYSKDDVIRKITGSQILI